MHAQVTVRSAPKDGNEPGEYEDSWRVREPAADKPLRVAMAGGAPASFLAGQWARTLTAALEEAGPEVTADAAEFARTVAAAARQWPGESDRGAYATLLVADVAADGAWHAAAVGDTCLFHVRESRLIQAFPVTEAGRPGDAPPVVGSRDTVPEEIEPMAALACGAAAPGDRLYACTGALAGWFLGECERGGRPWEVLDDIGEPFFETWLEEVREKGHLRDADVALVTVAFPVAEA